MPRDEASKAIQQIHATPLDALERQIANGEISDDLRNVLGPELAAELEHMTRTSAPSVLSAEERPLVVVLPGIIGSSLMNVVGDIGLIWLNPLALVAGKLALLRLDPSGQYDATPGVQIVASGLLPTHYLPIQMHLRVLGGCDVLAFPFDWRRTLDPAVEALRRLVMGHFQQSGRKAHLVGHSMGGLVARNFCLRYPAEAEQAVAQVIQLGSPNYGSCEPIRNLTTGSDTAELVNKLNPANQPLAFLRSCAGLYTMLPAPPEYYPSDAPFPYPYAGNLTIDDPAAYRVEGINQAHLQLARQGYEWLAGAVHLPIPCTIIAGYDLPTCLGVTVHEASGATPIFDFDAATTRDGDGTVPLASATALPGAKRLYGRGLKHGDLPLYRSVRRAVVDLIYRREPSALEHNPYSQVLHAETAEPAIPEHPLPGTLGELDLDVIAARIRTGQATPEDLQALASVQ